MSRVRLLRVIARMNVGGPALQIAGLMRHLDAEHYDQRLLVGAVEPGEADYLELRASDVVATRVPGLGRSLRAGGDARALASLIAEMRRFRPDVVHTHTAKAGLLGRVAARVTGVPAVVHTYHGHLLHGYFGPLHTRGVVTLERLLARRTDVLAAVGEAVRDDLLAAGIGTSTQFEVVPPGIELPPPPPRDEARVALGLPIDRPVIAFVARLTHVKRPDRMLEVARRVLADRPAVFAVVGEGALLTEIRAAARPLGDAVRFLGWRADVERVYAAADLALLTSDNEGMPVSLIEAAMSGTPAVTTAVGSAAEVVLDGRTGIVCPPDAALLARAVLDVLDDDALRAAMGAAAAVHGQARFGVRRLVADYDRIYRALSLGGSRSVRT